MPVGHEVIVERSVTGRLAALPQYPLPRTIFPTQSFAVLQPRGYRMLLSTLTLALSLFQADAPPVAQGKEPPAKLELFAKEDWYKSEKGKEQEFVGTLQKVDRKKGVVGFGRFNPYYLVMEAEGKKSTREVYV